MEKDKVKDASAVELTDAILELNPHDKSMICFRMALGYMTASYIDSVITGTHNNEYVVEEELEQVEESISLPKNFEPELEM